MVKTVYFVNLNQKLMAFSVIEEEQLFPVIRLADAEGTLFAEIYSRGALLNAFTLTQNNQQFNVIDGFASPQDAIDNITAGFKSARLSPFVCRVTAGKYQFSGHEYVIDKFFLGTEAIHGLLYDAPFTVTSKWAGEGEAFVTLEFDYDKKDEGFPFTYHSKITYTLREGGVLSVSSEITNTGNTEMPLVDGWHPYFTLGGTVNEWLFEMNTHQVLEFDNRLVPTGGLLEYTAFSTPRHMDETFLDNCFVLNDNTKPACVLTNSANGLQLTVQAVKNYPYLQVYTPPHRKSIAIENLSGAPDAFNNGIGLIIAKPGELYTFANDYTLRISR